MSKLPPLPESEGRLHTARGLEKLIRESLVMGWGQQVRDAALDEVADAMMKSDLSGLTKDQYLLNYTAQMLISWATYIRTLKNEPSTLKAST